MGRKCPLAGGEVDRWQLDMRARREKRRSNFSRVPGSRALGPRIPGFSPCWQWEGGESWAKVGARYLPGEDGGVERARGTHGGIAFTPVGVGTGTAPEQLLPGSSCPRMGSGKPRPGEVQAAAERERKLEGAGR